LLFDRTRYPDSSFIIHFTNMCILGHNITTIIQDKRVGPTISSGPLCRALLDVYLGASPIDAKAKLALASNAFKFHKANQSESSGKQPRAKL